MHGVIFAELEAFVNESYGGGTWGDLIAAADTENDAFLPTKSYPDGDAIAVLQTASDVTGKAVPQLLYEFGEYVAPQLLDMYGAQIDDRWGYLDLLTNTEEQIHKVVRRDKPEASPPELVAKRVGDDEVRIRYASERKMCPLLEGIAAGAADEYGESVDISQSQCMLDGSGECHVSIRTV